MKDLLDLNQEKQIKLQEEFLQLIEGRDHVLCVPPGKEDYGGVFIPPSKCKRCRVGPRACYERSKLNGYYKPPKYPF